MASQAWEEWKPAAVDDQTEEEPKLDRKELQAILEDMMDVVERLQAHLDKTRQTRKEEQ